MAELYNGEPINGVKPIKIDASISSFPMSIGYGDLALWAMPNLSKDKKKLSTKEVILKDAIERVNTFSVIAYPIITTSVSGIAKDYLVDSIDVYNETSINEHVLGEFAEDEGLKALGLYNIHGMTVKNKTVMGSDSKTVNLYFRFPLLQLDDYGEFYTDPKDIYLTVTVVPQESDDGEDDGSSTHKEAERSVTPVNPAGQNLQWEEIPKDDSTASNIDVSQIVIDPKHTKYTYINSVSLYDMHHPSPKNSHISSSGTLYSTDKYLRIHFDERYMDPITFTLNVTINDYDPLGNIITKRTSIDYNYTPIKSSVSGNKYPRIQKMNTPNVSYALLRTNPKLTGNVKVVVDSKNNIYLDTFKVSTSLEQKRFRHVKVNSTEYYGQTLMTKYKDVPTTDFYKIEDKCYNLFTTAQTYNSQYYDLYRYGVKTNDDKMYSENFALLAPLCVKEVIPDFFVVFKVDTTSSDYDESWDDTTKMKYFLKNGKVVKSYDMRKDSVLGEYVRTIYDRSTEYPGDAYLSYSATNHNKFIGISIDRGVVTSAYESTFMEENIQSQVAMNDFITEGFERNRLVSKNIINFEFMFNDTDAELFSIDTYFGMYVRVNTEDEDFSCIGKKEISDVDDAGEKEISVKYLFDSSVHTFDEKKGKLAENSAYSNLIYALTTTKDFIRINEGVDYAPQLEEYILKPYKNILSTEIKKIDSSICKSFLTFKLNNLLEIGDHIRIIDVKNQTIYEIVTTNVDNYTDENKISDVTTAYNRVASSFYTIKYVSIYIASRKDNEAAIGDTEEEQMENPMLADIIANQTEQLFYAFKKFESSSFAPFKYDNNTITILGKTDSLVFERICSPSGFTDEQKIYLEEDDTENNTIEFFDGVYANKLILNIDDVSWKFSTYIYLYPLYFEVVGNRMAHAMAFIDISSVGDKYLYAIDAPSPDVFDYKTLVYDSYDASGNIVSTKYDKIQTVSFTMNEDSGEIDLTKTPVNCVPSFYNDGKVFLNIRDPYTLNNTFNLYNSYPLNSGVCSFFNLKDFDFSVLDNDSFISPSNTTEKIGDSGEFTKETVFNEEQATAEDKGPETDSNGMYIFYYNMDGTVPETLSPVTDAKLYYHTDIGSHFIAIMNPDDTYPARSDIDWDNVILYHPLLKDTEDVDYSKYLADYIFQYEIGNDKAKAIGTDPSMTAYQVLNSLFYLPHQVSDEENVYPSVEPGTEHSETATKYTLFTSVQYYPAEAEYHELDPEDVGHYDASAWWTWPGNSEPTSGSLDDFLNRLASNMVNISLTKKYMIDRTKYNMDNESVWTPEDEMYFCGPDYNNPVYRKAYDYLSYPIWLFLYMIGGWNNVGELYPNPTVTPKNNDYTTTPIRTSSEENVKDYIDKHRSFYYDSENNMYDISKKGVSTKYFNNLFENNHVKSDISLTSPHACKWKGIGTDARGEDMRIMHDYKVKNKTTGEWTSVLNDASSYFACGSDTYSTYLGYLSYSGKDKDYPDKKKYISGTLNSLVPDYDNPTSMLGITEKEYILSGNGSIEDVLCSKNDGSNKFSVAYNAGEDMIEFISSGVKFRIKTNNNDAINLNNYNGYSAVFVSLPAVNKDYPKATELIIDETKKEIMLVWYQPTNTFKFGQPYGEIVNSYDLYNSIFYDRYVCRISHEETLRNISCAVENNINMMLLKDEAGYGTEQIHENPDYFGRRLCKKEGGFWIGSVGDITGYSKSNHVVLTGEIYPGVPAVPEDSSYLYGYYDHEKYITTVNPRLWYNEFHETATSTSIHNHCYDYNPSIEAFLITDDPTAIPNNIGSFSDLAKAVNSCSIYVKTAEGKKDYTTFANLLNISIIEPIKYLKFEGLGLDSERIDKKKEIELGYVHPSYAEPVTIDMFNFNYVAQDTTGSEETSSTSTGLEGIFEKSFDGGNIFLSNVNAISQVWFNKYTEEFNYCIKKVEKSEDEIIYKTKTSLGFEHNVSIMKDSWNTKLYRNYSTGSRDVEQFEYVPGYKTGYELKTFIHSRGINLNGSNGNTVEIVSWKNTEISKKNKYIRLDITDSLVYNILFRDAFNKYWKYLNLSDNTYKINYIKNTILPLININNKTKFVLYKNANLTNSLVFNSELDEQNSVVVTNYKNELKYENGKYYMYVYPEETTQYYAKMIIDL